MDPALQDLALIALLAGGIFLASHWLDPNRRARANHREWDRGYKYVMDSLRHCLPENRAVIMRDLEAEVGAGGMTPFDWGMLSALREVDQ